jgi:hypothetical protein
MLGVILLHDHRKAPDCLKASVSLSIEVFSAVYLRSVRRSLCLKSSWLWSRPFVTGQFSNIGISVFCSKISAGNARLFCHVLLGSPEDDFNFGRSARGHVDREYNMRLHGEYRAISRYGALH